MTPCAVFQAHIVSSHRSFVTRCDVVEIKGDGLSGRGDHLIMFLFSDMLEVSGMWKSSVECGLCGGVGF